MKEYTITFNGTTETWIRSDEEMSFEKAQEWIKEKGKTPTTVSNLWETDSETKKPRWLLLKEAGAKFLCWAEEDPEEIGKENPSYAYFIYLFSGYVNGYSRSSYGYYALCRVGF